MLDITFFIFIFVLIILIIYQKDKIIVKGLLIIRKTKRGKCFIERISKHRRVIKILSNIGIVVGFAGMVIASWYLISTTYFILVGEKVFGVKFVLPSPYQSVTTKPGVLLLPWWVWVIAVILIVVPHEFMHGIVCMAEKIKIKSIGWLIFIFLPGAFVEPDEKKLNSSNMITKLRVYASGSFANIVIAFIFLLLYMIISQAFVVKGVYPSGLLKGYPAFNANLSGAILMIENISIHSSIDIANTLKNIPIGSNITILTTKGVFNLTTTKHPEKNISFIGVTGPYIPYEISVFQKPLSDVLLLLRMLFFWIFVLSIGIGVINLLPIKPLDGGMMLEAVVGEKHKHVVKYISGIFIFLLVLNIMLGILSGI